MKRPTGLEPPPVMRMASPLAALAMRVLPERTTEAPDTLTAPSAATLASDRPTPRSAPRPCTSTVPDAARLPLMATPCETLPSPVIAMVPPTTLDAASNCTPCPAWAVLTPCNVTLARPASRCELTSETPAATAPPAPLKLVPAAVRPAAFPPSTMAPLLAPLPVTMELLVNEIPPEPDWAARKVTGIAPMAEVMVEFSMLMLPSASRVKLPGRPDTKTGTLMVALFRLMLPGSLPPFAPPVEMVTLLPLARAAEMVRELIDEPVAPAVNTGPPPRVFDAESLIRMS